MKHKIHRVDLKGRFLNPLKSSQVIHYLELMALTICIIE